MISKGSLRGACFCGETRLIIRAPAQNYLKLSAYCHCTRCQRLNGAPFIWTTHWTGRESVNWTTGKAPVTAEVVTGVKWRYRCSDCGSPMGSWNERKQQCGISSWSVWAPVIERPDLDGAFEWIKPTAHQFYETRLLDVNDNLPKHAGYGDSSERVHAA